MFTHNNPLCSLLCSLFVVLTLFVVGMSLSAAQAAPPAPVVLAASSLQNVLEEAAVQWERRGHAKPVLSFAASSALARQIEAGAPADLFLSADEDWMDDVAAKGALIGGTRHGIIGNRLVLIAPVNSPLRLRIAPGFKLASALGADRLAMADPDSVPAGKYGKAALTALGIWPQVVQKIAPAENVRAALLLVERGAAPLGIVYASDAMTSKAVRVVDVFPANCHPLIRYETAQLKTSASPEAAAFGAFLVTGPVRAIFLRHGFSPLPKP